MKIKFVKYFGQRKDNASGYEVWSNIYTPYMNCIGFVRDKYLIDTADYFRQEGYRVEIVDQYVFS